MPSTVYNQQPNAAAADPELKLVRPDAESAEQAIQYEQPRNDAVESRDLPAIPSKANAKFEIPGQAEGVDIDTDDSQVLQDPVSTDTGHKQQMECDSAQAVLPQQAETMNGMTVFERPEAPLSAPAVALPRVATGKSSGSGALEQSKAGTITAIRAPNAAGKLAWDVRHAATPTTGNSQSPLTRRVGV